jgi:hypothetical protein
MFAKRFTNKWLVTGLFFLAPFFPASMAWAQDIEYPNPRRMVVPAPVKVPDGKNLQEVKDAIYKSINGRGWTGKESGRT